MHGRVLRNKMHCLTRMVNKRTAALVTDATLQALEHEKVHSITSDNGKEFAFHEDISKQLGSAFYFAKPYHAWERGLNENTNGLIRQYVPKGSSFGHLTSDRIQCIEDKLNDRPRKCLGFKTPREVMLEWQAKNRCVALES